MTFNSPSISAATMRGLQAHPAIGEPVRRPAIAIGKPLPLVTGQSIPRLLRWGWVVMLMLPLVAASAQVRRTSPIPRLPQEPSQQQINVGQVIELLRPVVQQAVAEANEVLERTGSNARVELTSKTDVDGQSRQTEFPDRPHQPYVRLDLAYAIDIKLPEVQLAAEGFVFIELNFSCDGWQVGNGALRVEIEPRTCPSLENNGRRQNSFIEIPGYIEGHLEQRASAVLANYPAFKSRCTSISLVAHQVGNNRRQLPTAIAVNVPPIVRSIGAVATSRDTLQITFLSLKRLRAHRSKDDGIIYGPVENILLEAYANFTPREVGLFSMREGDSVVLNGPPLVVDAPSSGVLAILFNIFQLPNGTLSNSRGENFVRQQSYSPGVQTITIFKADPTRKGSYGGDEVKAYEVTFSIAYLAGTNRTKP
jgi:hypothetical protein